MSGSASVLRGVPVAAEARALPRPESRPRKSAERLSSDADTGSTQRSPSLPAGTISGTAPGNQPTDGNPASFDRSEIEELRKRVYLEALEQGRRDGIKEGNERGFEMGLAEGRQAGEEAVARQTHMVRQAISALVERLDQMLTTLPRQFEDQFIARLSGSEDDMVALCHSVICRLIGEKAFDRDSVVHCVQAAVAQCRGPSHARSAGQLAIHIHPADLEMLRADEMLSEWLKRHGSGPIAWRADETVRLGGCIVQTDRGSLDARLETQLSALHEILLAGRTQPVTLNDDVPRVAGNEAVP